MKKQRDKIIRDAEAILDANDPESFNRALDCIQVLLSQYIEMKNKIAELEAIVWKYEGTGK